MSFASPILLLTLLALPVAIWTYLLLERRRERRAAAWGAPALLPNVVPARPGRRRHVPAALYLVGIAFLLVGFARPQARLTTEREGATVVLAIDVSASMQARDVRPTRLEAARRAALAFVDELPSKYRVALVTFADHVSVPVTPTYDHNRLRRSLLLVPAGEATSLGEAIARSVRVARRATGPVQPGQARSPAAILLISDGAQTRGRTSPRQAAERARRADVPVYTVALGTREGVVERKLPGGFTERIQVPPDPATLRTVARESGGRFFAVRSAKRLEVVYRDLGTRLAHERKLREVTAGAAAAGLACMLVGAGLSGLWFRRLA